MYRLVTSFPSSREDGPEGSESRRDFAGASGRGEKGAGRGPEGRARISGFGEPAGSGRRDGGWIPIQFCLALSKNEGGSGRGGSKKIQHKTLFFLDIVADFFNLV